MEAAEQVIAERIPLEDIDSSFLAAYGYHAEKRILAVKFKTGQIRHHTGVSLETALEFGAAESKGRFYGQHIKGRYQAEAMTGDCPRCGDKHGWLGERCGDCGTAAYQSTERHSDT